MTESLTSDEEYGDENDEGPSPAAADDNDDAPERARVEDEYAIVPAPKAVEEGAVVVRMLSPVSPSLGRIPRPPPWFGDTSGSGRCVTPLPLPLKKKNVVTFSLSDID